MWSPNELLKIEKQRDILSYITLQFFHFKKVPLEHCPFGLPFTFTTYMVTEELITVEEGFINKRENDCYIYKVQDVELIRTLGERMFGLGTVKCYTGDTTNPELYLTHIKNAKNIKNFILEASEKARLKRRTMNMLDIGADGDIPEEN